MADFTMDRFSLKGKTALVTGAERGIGLEIAKGLAAAGANIIIAGLMEEEFPKAEAAYRNEQYILFFHVRDVYFLFDTKEKKMIVILFFIR